MEVWQVKFVEDTEGGKEKPFRGTVQFLKRLCFMSSDNDFISFPE